MFSRVEQDDDSLLVHMSRTVVIFSPQMSDQESSASASHTEDELDEELEGDEERDENQRDSPAPSLSSFSSTLRAVIRIKQKYQALKKRRQEMALGPGGAGAPTRTSPKIFTFDGLSPFVLPTLSSSMAQRKKRRKRKRVLYPNRRRRRVPPRQERSRATNCLYLLCAIVFLQVKNLIPSFIHLTGTLKVKTFFRGPNVFRLWQFAFHFSPPPSCLQFNNDFVVV